jgi:short subunit fatty acids transporter
LIAGRWLLRYVLALLLAVALLFLATAPLLLSIVGWGFGRHHYIEFARELAPLITPAVNTALTVGSLVIAAFVAYTTWLSPFKPIVQARPATAVAPNV